MSEPVGNSPRSAIPGNSHKTREAEAASESRDKVEKIIEGKVVTRKPNVWRRITRSMFADDISNVGDFVVTDVLVPALRNLLFDIVVQGSSRSIFGTARNARRSTIGGMGPVTSLKTAYHRVSEADPRELPREARAKHDFDLIVLDSHAEAVDVVESLIERVDRYGSASVADLYDFVGVTGSFQDQRWGWTNLAGADVRQVRDGFLLDLPKPTSLR